MDWDPLVDAAVAARANAHAPYSRFAVGAAVQAGDGSIYAGCNVENRSYGLALCAERTALAAMVAAGRRDLTAMLVMTEASPPSAPCGLCREAAAEFAHHLPILLVNPDGERRETDLQTLLPERFELPH